MQGLKPERTINDDGDTVYIILLDKLTDEELNQVFIITPNIPQDREPLTPLLVELRNKTDKLPTEDVTSSKPKEYSQTPSGDDLWTPAVTPESVLTITLEQPENPDTLEFTPQDKEDKPLDEDVSFTIQVKETPSSEPEPYSPQGNGLQEVVQ